jgi:hypothetical protein
VRERVRVKFSHTVTACAMSQAQRYACGGGGFPAAAADGERGERGERGSGDGLGELLMSSRPLRRAPNAPRYPSCARKLACCFPLDQKLEIAGAVRRVEVWCV